MAKRGSVRNRRRRWLLVVVSTGSGSSSLRVHSWRKLRALGARALHQGTWVLPLQPGTAKAVERLVERVRHDGGEARALPMTLLDPAQEAELIAGFQAERADEYREVLARTPAFVEEIEHERAKGRTTYMEVEECEADLARLRSWLARIVARDYFGAPGAAEAAAAVQECARLLAEFEAQAFAAEAPDPASAPTRRRRRPSS